MASPLINLLRDGGEVDGWRHRGMLDVGRGRETTGRQREIPRGATAGPACRPKMRREAVPPQDGAGNMAGETALGDAHFVFLADETSCQ